MSAFKPDPNMSLEETIVADRLHTYRDIAEQLDREIEESSPHNERWRNEHGKQCAQYVRELIFMYKLAAQKLKEAEKKSNA